MNVTRRLIGGAALTAALLVATAVPALAHVRIEGEGVAGERGTFSFRVPNERDDASTIMLEVQFP
ncbi:MAG: DUF1775 domain-containing protein, partial [Egibacteraceae bacterium]